MKKHGLENKNHTPHSMKKVNKRCIVYHFKYSSRSTAGFIFYFLQIILIRFNLASKIYIPKHEDDLVNYIISYANKKFSYAICKTLESNHNLPKFTIPIEFAIKKSAQLKITNEDSYQKLLWALVACSSIDKKSAKTLKKTTGLNFKNLF